MANNERTRTRVIIPTAMNMAVEINRIALENARKNKKADVVLPRYFDRMFMVYHESGVVPMVDYLTNRAV